jgi:hypothetical protein
LLRFQAQAQTKTSVELEDDPLQNLLPHRQVELGYEECIQTDETTVKNAGSILECIALAVKGHEVNRPPIGL